MHIPSNLDKYYKDYKEKQNYGNIISTFDLVEENNNLFRIYYQGNICKNIFGSRWIRVNEQDKMQIIAESDTKKYLIFDKDKCGYSNSFEKQNFSVKTIPQDFYKFICPRCSNDRFLISLFYEYIDEQVLKEEETVLEDYQNSYQWVRMNLKCNKCHKRIKNIIDYED